MAHLKTELLISPLQLLLLLATYAKQVLVDERQLVALKVDLLLGLLDSLVDLGQVDLHAKDSFLLVVKVDTNSQNGQKSLLQMQ